MARSRKTGSGERSEDMGNGLSTAVFHVQLYTMTYRKVQGETGPPASCPCLAWSRIYPTPLCSFITSFSRSSDGVYKFQQCNVAKLDRIYLYPGLRVGVYYIDARKHNAVPNAVIYFSYSYFFTMRSCIWLLVLGVNLAVAERNFGGRAENAIASDKESLIDSLVSNMTVEDLG